MGQTSNLSYQQQQQNIFNRTTSSGQGVFNFQDQTQSSQSDKKFQFASVTPNNKTIAAIING
jgi:hypothetical protein